ncbi:MAG: hypothetical protein KatS3mg031_0448 [Chitinophagales bacterium]|nr:MAG: hypothetical protein KatS3mg031_0448 [Chitinophagales bacterium]
MLTLTRKTFQTRPKLIMFFKSYRFIGSFPSAQDCPQTGLPEFAFGGRSNVGKSSLINYLTNNRHLARTSQTPGKTQLLNYYLVDERWYLVDLPGYGFAKVSKEKRHQFQQLIRDYLIQRSTLQCLFLLIDARIPPQPIDLRFVNWLGEHRIPFASGVYQG